MHFIYSEISILFIAANCNVKQQIDKDFKKDWPDVSFKLVHAIIHTTNSNIQNK